MSFDRPNQGLVVELDRGYDAFSIHPPALPNPSHFFANAASTGSLIKNTINVVLAIVSDAVIVRPVSRASQGILLTESQVYRTFIVWNCNYFAIILPILVLFADAGMSVHRMIFSGGADRYGWRHGCLVCLHALPDEDR